MKKESFCSLCDFYRYWYAQGYGTHEFCLKSPYSYSSHTHKEIRYKDPKEVNKQNKCKFFEQKGFWKANKSNILWKSYYVLIFLIMTIFVITCFFSQQQDNEQKKKIQEWYEK